MSKDVQVVEIIVDGGYQPNIVNLKAGQLAQLKFTRVNEKGCLDTVQSNDLAFSAKLPVNEEVTIAIAPQETGTYAFSCDMNMFKGKVVVA